MQTLTWPIPTMLPMSWAARSNCGWGIVVSWAGFVQENTRRKFGTMQSASCPATAGQDEELLRLNPRRLDDLAPFLGFGGDEGAEFFRRVPLRDDAHALEAFGSLRLLEIGDQSGVERVDDRLRRAGAG